MKALEHMKQELAELNQLQRQAREEHKPGFEDLEIADAEVKSQHKDLALKAVEGHKLIIQDLGHSTRDIVVKLWYNISGVAAKDINRSVLVFTFVDSISAMRFFSVVKEVLRCQDISLHTRIFTKINTTLNDRITP